MKVKKIKDFKRKNVLIFSGSARYRNNCPGQDSKTLQMIKSLDFPDFDFEIIDLSIKDEDPIIQPCKGCISTAGGAHCHWTCIGGDQRVQTEYGYKEISQIIENDILSTGLVEKSWNTSPKENIYEIVLTDGRRLKCTKNHYIKTLSNKRIRTINSLWKFYREEEYKKLEDIKIGDFMPEPILGGKFKVGGEYDEKYFLMAGLIWGDGTFCNDSLILFYDNITEPEHGKKIQEFFSDYIISIKEHKTNIQDDYIREGFRTKCEMMKINFGAKNGRIIKNMGFIKNSSHTRRLPEILFNSNEMELGYFFNGWFSTDGSVNNKGISLYNVSYECLRDAQLLLFKMGIKSSVYDMRKHKTIVRGKELERASMLSITGHDNLILYKNKIDFINPYKKNQLDKILSVKTKRMKNKPPKVKEINYIGEGPVYDLTISGTHEFITEGILVHNCDCYKKDDKEHPDFMYEKNIYEKLEKCDAFMVITPINWWSVPTQVKALFDRLTCASLTMTTEQAKKIFGEKNVKDPDVTKPFSETEEFKKIAKNHLEGKVAGFFIHGDDGADDYVDKKIPDSYKKYKQGIWEDPKSAIMPIVWQCRYMGIDVPDDLIESFYMNEEISYSEANDKYEKGKLDFAVDKMNNFVKKVYNYIK